MSGSKPPYSVSLSFDDQENDDRSDVTWSSAGESNEGAQRREQKKEGFNIARLIGTKPTEDTSDYSNSQLCLPCNSRGEQGSAGAISPRDKEKRRKELLHMELKIAKQKEKLDILASKLRQSQAEAEVLKKEKISLIDELAVVRDSDDEQPAVQRGPPPRGGVGGGGGSMQMLLETNAKLMMENVRRQVSEDAVRKSFESHVRYCARRARADNETIESLQRENELLQQRLSSAPHHAKGGGARLSWSDHTSKTSLDRSLFDKHPDDNAFPAADIGQSQHSAADSAMWNSLHSIPEQEDVMFGGTCGEVDWTGKGGCEEDIDASDRSPNRRRSTVPGLSKSEHGLELGSMSRSRSMGLLVEFGETTRRPRSMSDAARQQPDPFVFHRRREEDHQEEDNAVPIDVSQHSCPEIRGPKGGNRQAYWSSGLSLGARMLRDSFRRNPFATDYEEDPPCRAFSDPVVELSRPPPRRWSSFESSEDSPRRSSVVEIRSLPIGSAANASRGGTLRDSLRDSLRRSFSEKSLDASQHSAPGKVQREPLPHL